MTLNVTLTGLSLFFKSFPFLTLASLLHHHSLCLPKLGSFSDMEYYFYHLGYQDLKVLKRFVGLIQIQFSPYFDCNWGEPNDPTTWEMSQVPTGLHVQGH